MNAPPITASAPASTRHPSSRSRRSFFETEEARRLRERQLQARHLGEFGANPNIKIAIVGTREARFVVPNRLRCQVAEDAAGSQAPSGTITP
jgi:hypothetical protein